MSAMGSHERGWRKDPGQPVRVRTEPTLTLRSPGDGNWIDFSDERSRAGDRAPANALASVTLSGTDSSWGEFMDRNALLMLRTWIDRVLAVDP